MDNLQTKPIASSIVVLSTAVLVWIALTGSVSGVVVAADHLAGTPTPDATRFPLDTLPVSVYAGFDTNLSEEMTRRMDEIQQQVIQIRGLLPTTRLPRVLLSREDHALNVQDGDFGYESNEAAASESYYLNALGLIDPSFDLHDYYAGMYTNEIAGYYDDETKEMYVIDTDSFGINDQLTYAHEYVHALQDQNFDFRNKLAYREDTCAEFPDRCAAVQALIEGDATLTEYMWQDATYSQSDAADYIAANGYPMSSNPNLPVDYFYDDLFFPYQYGTQFVSYLYSQGGWPAVNAAYTNLPRTTEQIMHPEKYPVENAIPVLLPATLAKAIPAGFLGTGQTTMGEWELFLAMAGVNSSESANQPATVLSAVAGWGGDGYEIFINPDSHETIFVQQLKWDTLADADEFLGFFKTYGANRWPVTEESDRADLSAWHSGSEFAAIWQSDQSTFWVVAPDSNTRTAILTRVGAMQ